MAKQTANNRAGFGTAPVFFTAISTILGAILFLRFGWGTGMLGLWGIILVILLGHAVTIPTALAISELATNKRVEGGGEYFIISRSFGLNLGGTIGLALFLSQAVSVGFYVIAFTEAFSFFFDWVKEMAGVTLPRQVISIPVMAGLGVLILKKGANLGVKALYFVVALLFISIALFFAGKPVDGFEPVNPFTEGFRNMDQFFLVFAVIFPAFTGMTAGVGLSGDLKNPARSIPIGTTLGTLTGMVIYFFISWKLAASAPAGELISDQLIMSRIALLGWLIVPVGLAASTISSALGSVMVAPRTLQALAHDRLFPLRSWNNWLAKGRETDNEPVHASLITVIIAMAIVAVGDVNLVAGIISMFFMVTYGTLCLISFLYHFGASPAYRPSFQSRWYFSLAGFIVALWVMFKINTVYAFSAILVMVLLYQYLARTHKNRNGVQAILSNALFQVNRNIQVFLQNSAARRPAREWRPSAICISDQDFEHSGAIDFLNWLSYRHGFGTYLYLIEGYYSAETVRQAESVIRKMLRSEKNAGKHVYIDTIISPSYTSAIAQAIQMPGIAGMENNMVIFEFHKERADGPDRFVENFGLVRAGQFDVCLVGTSSKPVQKKAPIHLWIRSSDTDNASLMILTAFIIVNHPQWRKSEIHIFEFCKKEEEEKIKKQLDELVVKGRLPITPKNIRVLTYEESASQKEMINRYSAGAGLVIMGFREESLKHFGADLFRGYESLGMTLFMNAARPKPIE
ncbi:MAG: Na-K-Cl cotransporter [Bacteroidales bacterium]